MAVFVNSLRSQIRSFSCRSGSLYKDQLKIETSLPPSTGRDWIGPPDPDSNLRPVRIHVPDNESANERHFRELRQELNVWNQEFWAKHNREFFMRKEEFINGKLRKLGAKNPDGSDRRLTPEELSQFYKSFLDEKRTIHTHYNREWYKKNFFLLWPAFRVTLEGILKRPGR